MAERGKEGFERHWEGEGGLAGSGDWLNIKVGVGTWKFLTSTTDNAGTQAPRKSEDDPAALPRRTLHQSRGAGRSDHNWL